MNDQPELSPEQRAKLKAELLAELKAELKQDAEQSEPVKPEPEKPNNPNVFPYKNYSASTDPEPPTKPVESNNEPTTKDTPELSKYDKYIMEKRAENKRAEKQAANNQADQWSAGDTVLALLVYLWIFGGAIVVGGMGPGYGFGWGIAWFTIFKIFDKSSTD